MTSSEDLDYYLSDSEDYLDMEDPHQEQQLLAATSLISRYLGYLIGGSFLDPRPHQGLEIEDKNNWCRYLASLILQRFEDQEFQNPMPINIETLKIGYLSLEFRDRIISVLIDQELQRVTTDMIDLYFQVRPSLSHFQYRWIFQPGLRMEDNTGYYHIYHRIHLMLLSRTELGRQAEAGDFEKKRDFSHHQVEEVSILLDDIIDIIPQDLQLQVQDIMDKLQNLIWDSEVYDSEWPLVQGYLTTLILGAPDLGSPEQMLEYCKLHLLKPISQYLKMVRQTPNLAQALQLSNLVLVRQAERSITFRNFYLQNSDLSCWKRQGWGLWLKDIQELQHQLIPLLIPTIEGTEWHQVPRPYLESLYPRAFEYLDSKFSPQRSEIERVVQERIGCAILRDGSVRSAIRIQDSDISKTIEAWIDSNVDFLIESCAAGDLQEQHQKIIRRNVMDSNRLWTLITRLVGIVHQLLCRSIFQRQMVPILEGEGIEIPAALLQDISSNNRSSRYKRFISKISKQINARILPYNRVLVTDNWDLLLRIERLEMMGIDIGDVRELCLNDQIRRIILEY